MNHTHSPWMLAPVDSCTVAVVDEEGCHIVDLVATLNTTAQSSLEGNARLIAAAPAMLSALQELLLDPYLSNPINNARMASARAAIRAATGEA